MQVVSIHRSINNNHKENKFQNKLDNEQYQFMFKMLRNSRTISSMHIPQKITEEIAEYSTGLWKMCSNKACARLISVLRQDLNANPRNKSLHFTQFDKKIFFCGICQDKALHLVYCTSIFANYSVCALNRPNGTRDCKQCSCGNAIEFCHECYPTECIDCSQRCKNCNNPMIGMCSNCHRHICEACCSLTRYTEEPYIPHSDKQYPRFNIENKYKRVASDIYDTLLTLKLTNASHTLHFFALIVAEYTATQYLNCIECRSSFGLIDCGKDYELRSRNIVMLDENDDILYYLCWEMNADIMYSENYEAIECDEILCHKCGKKWRCYICGYQTFAYNDNGLIPGGCYYCKQNICDYCAYYVDSRQVGICDKCYYDDDICAVKVNDDGIITNILN